MCLFAVIVYAVFSRFHTLLFFSLYCIVSQAGYHSLRCHGFIHAAACMLGEDSRTEKKSLVSYVLVDMERLPFEGGTDEWR
jgi:hypothetical protein